jgi:type I site-specific restriction endonuclease
MKPEQKARDQIDLLLEATGWKVQEINMTINSLQQHKALIFY